MFDGRGSQTQGAVLRLGPGAVLTGEGGSCSIRSRSSVNPVGFHLQEYMNTFRYTIRYVTCTLSFPKIAVLARACHVQHHMQGQTSMPRDIINNMTVCLGLLED